MKICKRCGVEYTLSKISKKYINKDISKYEFCTNCRKFKKCEFCNLEFHHKQNRTCSIDCSKKLKERSFIKSCGANHNFSRESISRIEWEERLFREEGIINVFQRESVKKISKKTLIDKYGVDHISKSEEIKKGKKKKLIKRIKDDPGFYKRIWIQTHHKLIHKLGYDPRLHVFGKASKESLNVFSSVIDWCVSIGIDYNDIYLGIDGKSEFFLRSDLGFFMYDFTIRSKRIMIEYHGVSFHAREGDEEWRHVFTNENYVENIKRRNIKNNLASLNGFQLLEIWSDEEVDKNIKLSIDYIKKILNYEDKKN